MGVINGGDYHYYKNFDGTSNSLDKFLTKKIVIQARDKELSASEFRVIPDSRAEIYGKGQAHSALAQNHIGNHFQGIALGNGGCVATTADAWFALDPSTRN
jgi:hypothetical protein